MALDLKSIHNKNVLTDAVNAHVSSRPAAAAIASTALMIVELQTFLDDAAPHSSFIPERLLLLRPHTQAPPSDAIQKYLHELAVAAEAEAAAGAYSSILAGQGSESDDTGDIAFWIGNGGGDPQAVLGSLGLTSWASTGEITAVKSFPPLAQVSGLKDKFAFRARSPMSGAMVVFFLVGRVEKEGWGGLIGIGTYGD